MEFYREVRLAFADGMSKCAAAHHFTISRDTVDKALPLSLPPGYRRSAAIKRPKMDEFASLLSNSSRFARWKRFRSI